MEQKEEIYEKEVYEKLLSYYKELHMHNQKRIRTGLKCLFFVPLVFLALLFITDSEKVIFLIFWIVSLFCIAAYLIYVEYADFKMQVLVAELQNSEFDPKKGALIGHGTEQLESNIIGTLDQLDVRKEQVKERIADKMEQLHTKEKTEGTDEEHIKDHTE
jgi:hypothetical protein